MDGVYLRDEVLKLKGLLDEIQIDTSNPELAEVVLWCLSCLMKDQPSPSKEVVSYIFGYKSF